MQPDSGPSTTGKNSIVDTIAHSPMGRLQIVVICLCALLNAIDGFDVLAISFAAPGIARDWGISPAALGIVLSMELVGMAVGSVALGTVADALGRRPMILLCLVVMTIGMFLAATAGGIETLLAYRFLTGLGVGGCLAATNTLGAEFTNLKWRAAAVTLIAAGYPIGNVIGGTTVSVLLTTFDWRSVFVFGGVVTAAAIPLIWFLLPESMEFQASKRRPDALKKINSTLARMGRPPIDALPEIDGKPERVGLGRLFKPDLLMTTFLLTVAYFAHVMTFYFVLKWIPKLVVDMGFQPSLAGSVLVWAAVGGVFGALVLAALTARFSVRWLVAGAMALSCVGVIVFGGVPADLKQLSIVAAVVGVFTNIGLIGLYALFVQAFPTEVRAGGIGFVIGVGRGAAILGPVFAGFLLNAGQSIQVVAIVMAMGSLAAALAVLGLRLKD